jgi:hypothetical protein
MYGSSKTVPSLWKLRSHSAKCAAVLLTRPVPLLPLSPRADDEARFNRVMRHGLLGEATPYPMVRAERA